MTLLKIILNHVYLDSICQKAEFMKEFVNKGDYIL